MTRRENESKRGKGAKGASEKEATRREAGMREWNEEGPGMQIRRKRDARELLSYVSQNYKTLILELPSARASALARALRY